MNKVLKFVDTEVTFAEVPDEITLCINISNCPCNCKGCHSPYLSKNIGNILDEQSLSQLIERNTGITCVAFMGGDSHPFGVNKLAHYIKTMYPKLKTAWYSGRDFHSACIDLSNFNYIKLGPYIEDKGPLNSPTTNQKFYEVVEGYKLVNRNNRFLK